MGYLLGKAEGEDRLWHGHVSAVTVAPAYRRLGLAHTLMNYFEHTCTHVYDNYFVDLFVRQSNGLARDMYEKFGYSTYRQVIGYYSGEHPENALDMRKALLRYVYGCGCVSGIGSASLTRCARRDKEKESIVPLDHPIYPEDLEW